MSIPVAQSLMIECVGVKEMTATKETNKKKQQQLVSDLRSRISSGHLDPRATVDENHLYLSEGKPIVVDNGCHRNQL